MLAPIRARRCQPEVTGRRRALASARGLTPGGGRSTAWYQAGQAAFMPDAGPRSDP